jgi:hypothetical protein
VSRRRARTPARARTLRTVARARLPLILCGDQGPLPPPCHRLAHHHVAAAAHRRRRRGAGRNRRARGPAAGCTPWRHHVAACGAGAALQWRDGAARAHAAAQLVRALSRVAEDVEVQSSAARRGAARAPARRRSGAPPPWVVAARFAHQYRCARCPTAGGRRVQFASAAAECWLARLARRGAARCRAVHAGRAGEAASASRRGASRHAAVSRCTPRYSVAVWAGQWMPRRRMRAGDWGAVRAVLAIKDGIAVTWVCLGRKGHVCTVGDRVWGVAGRVSRVAAIAAADPDRL